MTDQHLAPEHDPANQVRVHTITFADTDLPERVGLLIGVRRARDLIQVLTEPAVHDAEPRRGSLRMVASKLNEALIAHKLRAELATSPIGVVVVVDAHVSDLAALLDYADDLAGAREDGAGVLYPLYTALSGLVFDRFWSGGASEVFDTAKREHAATAVDAGR